MTETRQFITKRSDARKFLSRAGTKVAIEVGHSGTWVFMEKTDFVKCILPGRRGEFFVDYNGTTEATFAIGNILHIPIGVS